MIKKETILVGTKAELLTHYSHILIKRPEVPRIGDRWEMGYMTIEKQISQLDTKQMGKIFFCEMMMGGSVDWENKKIIEGTFEPAIQVMMERVEIRPTPEEMAAFATETTADALNEK